MKTPIAVYCEYCSKEAVLATGEKIYPHRDDLKKIKLWECEPCKAYVGCHKLNIPKGIYSDEIPLGRLANAELRKAKSLAHYHFDMYWRKEKYQRSSCYDSLAIKMGINIDKCHIGMFNVAQCEQVVEICKKA